MRGYARPMAAPTDPVIPAPADAGVRVQLLDRAGCHLCAQARGVVEAEAARAGTAVEVLDVDADPALREAWGDQVPVVVVDGRVHARYRVEAAALAHAMRPGPRWRRLLPGA